ncbi:TlpA disulfide reductase family protein [Pedobacter sp. L105]|uniref:TlpA family protein disulfide reductase n=1 Tax=Pedobacter sp. L105 TaxID=1641871 RepID=UPI00131ADAEC|nr:TlpA disulfide reductase family protein [Pedobacter sp. L105]
MKIFKQFFFIGVISILSSFAVKAQDSLIIIGKIDKRLDEKIITMEKVYPFPNTLPTTKTECIIKDGKFFFSIPATALEQYHIRFKNDHSPNDFVSLLLLPKKTEIEFLDSSLVNYTLVGNNINGLYNNSILPITNRREFTQEEVNRALTTWVENHVDSPLNTYMMVTTLLNNVSDDEISRLFNLIPDANRKGTYFNELKFIKENLYVGKILPDFVQADTSGIPIKLSDFRGKYILVDFWASWCKPCRAENPHLVAAMKKYDHKKFDIISVSLDSKKSDWLEAISKDGLQNWTHVSDLKGWNNGVSIYYKLIAIPRNFLLDPSGKIIAKNLRGQDVLDMLNKIID